MSRTDAKQPPRVLTAAAVARIQSLGPYFRVQTHPAGSPAGHPWAPMAELIDGPAATARLQAVGAALAAAAPPGRGQLPTRVVASTAHLGLVAQPIAVAVAAVAIGVGAINWATEELWWQAQLGGPYPLSVSASTRPELQLEGSFVAELTQAWCVRYTVSSQVLWGNVGSAANSAAMMIAQAAPSLTDAALQAAASILRDPRIADGTLRPGPGFRRHSCCLIYQLNPAQPAVCGDCILAS